MPGYFGSNLNVYAMVHAIYWGDIVSHISRLTVFGCWRKMFWADVCLSVPQEMKSEKINHQQRVARYDSWKLFYAHLAIANKYPENIGGCICKVILCWSVTLYHVSVSKYKLDYTKWIPDYNSNGKYTLFIIPKTLSCVVLNVFDIRQILSHY